MKQFFFWSFSFLFSSSCLFSSPIPTPSHAILRELSPEFSESLKQHEPHEPIDVGLAQKQHENYVRIVKELVGESTILPSAPHHPDSNFIEDTAIIVGRRAVISRMGARSRRGEEEAVRKVLQRFPFEEIHEMTPPATMDGGDILSTGKHLFVGLSSRTNEAAVKQLEEFFSHEISVVALPVEGSLHLKSLMTLLTENVLVVSDDSEGRKLAALLHERAPSYEFLFVPDRVAANVVRIGDHLLIQSGFESSEAVLRARAQKEGLEVVSLEMSELIKADGALTCGSLLF